MTSIKIVKVVSRNFLADFWGNLQNAFGQNLGVYERMVDNAIIQIEDELKSKSLSTEKMKFYRYELTQLTNGALVVLFYGEW